MHDVKHSNHKQYNFKLSVPLALSYSSNPQVPLLPLGSDATEAGCSFALQARAEAVHKVDAEGVRAHLPGSRPTARCSGRAASVAPLNGDVRRHNHTFREATCVSPENATAAPSLSRPLLIQAKSLCVTVLTAKHFLAHHFGPLFLCRSQTSLSVANRNST